MQWLVGASGPVLEFTPRGEHRGLLPGQLSCPLLAGSSSQPATWGCRGAGRRSPPPREGKSMQLTGGIRFPKPELGLGFSLSSWLHTCRLSPTGQEDRVLCAWLGKEGPADPCSPDRVACPSVHRSCMRRQIQQQHVVGRQHGLGSEWGHVGLERSSDGSGPCQGWEIREDSWRPGITRPEGREEAGAAGGAGAFSAAQSHPAPQPAQDWGPPEACQEEPELRAPRLGPLPCSWSLSIEKKKRPPFYYGKSQHTHRSRGWLSCSLPASIHTCPPADAARLTQHLKQSSSL